MKQIVMFSFLVERSCLQLLSMLRNRQKICAKCNIMIKVSIRLIITETLKWTELNVVVLSTKHEVSLCQ